MWHSQWKDVVGTKLSYRRKVCQSGKKYRAQNKMLEVNSNIPVSYHNKCKHTLVSSSKIKIIILNWKQFSSMLIISAMPKM
jgi:hypothetical protein